MKNYSKGHLAAAVRAVNAGKMSYRQAERAYGVPRSTISEHVQRLRTYAAGRRKASRGSFIAGAATTLAATTLPRIKKSLSAQEQAALDRWRTGQVAPVAASPAPQVAPQAVPAQSRRQAQRVVLRWLESPQCPVRFVRDFQAAWVHGALGTVAIPREIQDAAARLWGAYGSERD